MGVWRRWILPITRLVVLAAIAVALVRMAFFGTTTEEASEVPTGSVVESRVPASIATVVNDVTVKGSIQPDPDVAVKATLQGKVSKVVAGQGATLAAGDPILVIRQETPVDPVVAADGTVTQPKPKVVTETVTASAAGSLAELGVLVGQEVAVGDAVGRIAPPTFRATAPLTAEEQYRLVTQPTAATVAITSGPAPFECSDLRIGQQAAASGTGATGAAGDTGSTGATESASTGATVSCAVPAGTRVFPGLAADITIPAGEAPDVLTLPTTAVEGLADTGNVWLASDGGEPEERAVGLGISDGKVVQITSGLAEGDMVLEFVPGAPVPEDEAMMMQGGYGG
ncbi:Multidrug resistance protein MdtA [Clavibacter michiganensis]|uniref:Multidrug resistance protein MdtA n=1 Tax=Clavibacter michiganensis TaxID=28447 RepID=A0A251Y5D4_9MICO|nr:efflux RND transporter periplasmic adaptor subunit [Clavibacter michiganensis]OUE19233.1 Multidrug resistance protein MdtA [Clavibacter michiganensis]